MKMTKIEKRFVNRKNKAEGNIRKIQQAFQKIEIDKIHTVLELGCGVGFVATHLAESYNFVVYGTDYDADQIQITNEIQPKMEQLHFQVEDAIKLSFADSSIDLVLAQNVFHHIPGWEAAILEIARVLRSGGYFIWLDLTLLKFIKKIFHPFVKNYGLYTLNDIRTAFEEKGFKILFQERVPHGPFKQHHFVLQLE
ncbi:MAG: class I SAM-dependent methyltransferase [bacterium]|nr:class I SAM-dependent methyltransferase [bacterium]